MFFLRTCERHKSSLLFSLTSFQQKTVRVGEYNIFSECYIRHYKVEMRIYVASYKLAFAFVSCYIKEFCR